MLFLDEPTTGLDASASHAIVTVLRELAAAGHTVVMTIHQPSAATTALFDRLLLLWSGRVAYDGPADAAATAFLRAALGPADAAAVLREDDDDDSATAAAGGGLQQLAASAASSLSSSWVGGDGGGDGAARRRVRWNPADAWLRAVSEPPLGRRVWLAWTASALAADSKQAIVRLCDLCSDDGNEAALGANRSSDKRGGGGGGAKA